MAWDRVDVQRATLSGHPTIATDVAMAHHLAVGRELSGPGLMYVLNHGPAPWGDAGESGHAYVERSDMLNAFPETLRAPVAADE